MHNSRWIGHIYLLIGAIIYGANHTLAKLPMPEYISAKAFVLTRNMGAMVFFWLLSIFLPRQTPDKKDIPNIFLAALFGIALNQMLFFKGLELTSPIHSAIIMTTAPIIVLLIAYIFLKDSISIRQLIGIGTGITGVVLLMYFALSSSVSKSPNPQLGDLFIFLNACSYALYLVISKPLLQKYDPIHFLKWIVTIGFLLQFPFSIEDWLKVRWSEMPPMVLFAVFEVVVMISCMVYLLNLMALKKLKSTTVSAYIFAQPLIATIFALLMGKDNLDIFKIIGGLMILFGVYLVSFPARVDKK